MEKEVTKTTTIKELKAEIKRLNRLLYRMGKINRSVCEALVEIRRWPKK